MLETYLGFENVKICKNYSKADVEEVMERLKKQALTFETANKGKKATQCFAIFHIGPFADPLSGAITLDLLNNLGLPDQKTAPKGPGTYEPFYEITSTGEIMNLNEQAARIADTREAQKEECDRQVAAWKVQWIRKNVGRSKGKEPELPWTCAANNKMYATDGDIRALIEGDNHAFIAEQNEAGVFQSKTFVLMLDDKQDKKSQLFEAHMNATSTKE
jgi:hypothetical protein